MSNIDGTEHLRRDHNLQPQTNAVRARQLAHALRSKPDMDNCMAVKGAPNSEIHCCRACSGLPCTQSISCARQNGCLVPSFVRKRPRFEQIVCSGCNSSGQTVGR